MGSSISWDLVQYSTEHGGAKQHKPVVIKLQYIMGSSLSVLEREKESATERPGLISSSAYVVWPPRVTSTLKARELMLLFNINNMLLTYVCC